MTSRSDQRKSAFKKAIDVDENRSKRRDADSSIRKSKREESMLKKRREGIEEEVEAVVPEVSIKDGDLESYVVALNSTVRDLIYDGAHRIRKMLSVEKSPPIEVVVRAGAVGRFVTLLTHPDSQIQFESAWALTNIASGTSEQTKLVVQSGAIPHFIQLLYSTHNDVRDQAVWALGNIAGDGPECRNYLLQCNVLPALLQIFTPNAPIGILRNATWTLSNLCRGKPAPDFSLIRVVLPTVLSLIQSEDNDILVDACWTSSYLTDGPNSKIGACIEAGFVPFLVKNMSHHSPKVHIPALRAVGNIVTGDENQTQVVLNANPLATFSNLLASMNKSVRKEACWAVSNITAGSVSQIQSVINGNLMPTLISLMEKGDFDVRREACWAIGNAVSGGSDSQIAHLVQRGCIKPLCDLFGTTDAKLTMLILNTLEGILRAGGVQSKYGDSKNKYLEAIEEAGGAEKLEELQEHENEDVYKKAVSIIREYFDTEEEEENKQPKITSFMFNSAPQTTQNNVFNF